MKKVSTVGAKQSKNFRDQKLTIGLDLGDRSSWYCVREGRRGKTKILSDRPLSFLAEW
jgi:hypothetical protein